MWPVHHNLCTSSADFSSVAQSWSSRPCRCHCRLHAPTSPEAADVVTTIPLCFLAQALSRLSSAGAHEQKDPTRKALRTDLRYSNHSAHDFCKQMRFFSLSQNSFMCFTVLRLTSCSDSFDDCLTSFTTRLLNPLTRPS